MRAGPNARRQLSWAYAVFMAGAGIKCTFSSKWCSKRVLVILKSPFHFKLAKHRVGYRYMRGAVSLVCPADLKQTAVRALRGAHAGSKPHLCRYEYRRALSMIGLIE